MNKKKIIILIVTTFFVCIGVTCFAFRYSSRAKIDVVEVNDIVQTLAERWNALDQTDLPGLQYSMEYVVIDNEGNFIAATRRGLNNDINSAVSHRDTIVDITRNHEPLGKLIIYNDSSKILQSYRVQLLSFVLILLFGVALLCITYAQYYDRTIFRPFRKLQSFAQHVAVGNLETPLEMDKNNMFGAFTESFDLMRDQTLQATFLLWICQ